MTENGELTVAEELERVRDPKTDGPRITPIRCERLTGQEQFASVSLQVASRGLKQFAILICRRSDGAPFGGGGFFDGEQTTSGSTGLEIPMSRSVTASGTGEVLSEKISFV